MAKEAFMKLAEDKRNTIINCGIAEFSKKSYSEASTDEITKNCGISKGLLFHYFGSKKNFYFYCLEQALGRLITEQPEPEAEDFYEIIFSLMDEKISLCRELPEETRFANMAAREMNHQIFREKNEVLAKYMIKTREKSARVMAKAVAALHLKERNIVKIMEAITLYTGAIINRYLEIYKENPDALFQQAEGIKAEIREYLDFLLYGVAKEERD